MDTLNKIALSFKDVVAPSDKGKGIGTSRTNTRVFLVNSEKSMNQDDVLTCMFHVNHTYANTLFDSGANMSFSLALLWHV